MFRSTKSVAEENESYSEYTKRRNLRMAEQLMNDGQPMCCTNCCYNYATFCMLLGFAILAGLAVLALQLQVFTPSTAHARDYLVWDDDKVRAWDLQ